MTYWGLNAIFLGVVAVVGIAALLASVRRRGPDTSRTSAGTRTRTRKRSRTRTRTTTRTRTASIVLAVAILLVMTAVFDNVMIGIGLVGYDAAKISGVFIGIAPLEDFSYSVAALVLLPSLWLLLGDRRSHSHSHSHSHSGSQPQPQPQLQPNSHSHPPTAPTRETPPEQQQKGRR